MPKPNVTRFSSLAVNPSSTSKDNGFYAPQLTTALRDAIPMEDLQDGIIIYNSDTETYQGRQDGAWVDDLTPGGNVIGPAVSIEGNIATFADDTGKLIQDSGVVIGRVPAEVPLLRRKTRVASPNLLAEPNVDVNEISNLGHLKFIEDGGAIYVGGLSPVSFNEADLGGGDFQICSVFTSGLPDGPSTPSALVEINSATGALVLSRMDTDARDDLFQTEGMVLFNTDSKGLNLYRNGGWGALGEGTVASITTGTGLTGGVITTAGTIGLADTAVIAGSYSYSNITVDAQGRITAATSGPSPVTSVSAGTGVSITGIASEPIVNLSNTSVTPGSYAYGSFTVNQQGQITAATNGTSPVTNIIAGTGINITGTTTPTVSITNTTVTAGSYASANITVDSQGRITSAANGGDGSGDVTGPGSSVAGDIVTFANTTGKVIADSSINIADIYYAGHPTTIIDTSGSTNNLFLGTNVGNSTLTGTGNISFSLGSLTALTTGINNFAAGLSALSSCTESSDNIAIGNKASYSITDGDIGLGNIAIGTEALYNNIGGDCIAIGKKALYNNLQGIASIAIGNLSQFTGVGIRNVTIGESSLQLENIGFRNVAVGTLALNQCTGGANYNVAIGDEAGGAGTLYTQCTFLGCSADATVNGLTNATAIGYNAKVGTSNSIILGASGTRVAVGTSTPNASAILDLTSTTGALVLPRMTTAQRDALTPINGMEIYNTTSKLLNYHNGTSWADVGSGTVTSITAGIGLTGGTIATSGTINMANTAVTAGSYTATNITVDAQGRITSAANGTVGNVTGPGSSVAGDIATFADATGKLIADSGVKIVDGGSSNLFLGKTVGNSSLSGMNNISFSINSLTQLTTGTGNVSMGNSALAGCTSGLHNIAIGTSTLSANQVNNNNIAIGTSALMASTGDNNLAFGTQALQANTTASNNLAIGYQALYSNKTGIQNFAFGTGALFNNVAGQYNIAIGGNALSNNTVDGNVGIGYQSLQNNVTGLYNLAIGYQALQNNTVDGNVGIGYQALTLNTTGTNNVVIGSKACASNTSGIQNVAVGALAMNKNTVGVNNSALGIAALYGNINGSQNVAVGQSALYSNVDGIQNVAVGSGALGINTQGDGNVAIGQGALSTGSITGNYNIGIGFDAGLNASNPTNCIFIGANADTSISGLTNATAIGYNATVEQDNSMVLGNGANVGIGTSMPKAKLHVVGGQIVNRVATTTSYTALVTDYIIAVTSTAAVRTITLPSATLSNAGQVYIIKDESGGAATNNINIVVSGGGNIDDTSTALINQNYGALQFYSSGSQWFAW